MDTLRLRYFLTFAESGHLRQSAEILGISPPALSKAIKQLEEELGKELVVPDGRGLMITPYARDLVQKVAPILGQLDQVLSESVLADVAPLRIGTFEVFSSHFAGVLCREDLKARSLSFLELLPGQIEEALARDEIDIGVTYIPVPHAKVEHLRVGQVQMGVYGLKSKFKSVDFSQLPFAVPIRNGTPNRMKGLDGWPEGKFPRQIRYQVTLMETALELCRQGLAVGYLPSFVVELHNQKVLNEYRLERLPSPLSVKAGLQAVFLAKRRDQKEGDDHKKISRSLRRVIAGQ
jgi:DNA-binding transcriptional LysR family regulator